jgi:YfiH family protein
MNIELYINEEEIVAGMTLRDDEEPESGNMALHTCSSANDVIKNRIKFASFLGCDLGSLTCSDQTHSDNFVEVSYTDRGRGALEQNSSFPDTDAIFTFEPNILLGCFTADCVPVIFFNKACGLIGVIHSGWRGTVNEISLKVFKHLIFEKTCNPVDFQVFIGKALSQEKFEVDGDVYKQFIALGYAEPYIVYNCITDKYHIDNKLTVKKQCELAGIPPEQIYVDPACTFKNPQCFSYREDQTRGRHMSFIMRKSRQRIK